MYIEVSKEDRGGSDEVAMLYTMPVGSWPSTFGNLFAASTTCKSGGVMRLHQDEIDHFINNQHRLYYPVICATHGELMRIHLVVFGHHCWQMEVGNKERVDMTDEVDNQHCIGSCLSFVCTRNANHHPLIQVRNSVGRYHRFVVVMMNAA